MEGISSIMGVLNVLGCYVGVEPDITRRYLQRDGTKWGIDEDGFFYRKFGSKYQHYLGSPIGLARRRWKPVSPADVPEHVRTELQQ